MSLLQFIGGKGGFMILAAIAAIIFFYNKYKNWRFFHPVHRNKKK